MKEVKDSRGQIYPPKSYNTRRLHDGMILGKFAMRQVHTYIIIILITYAITYFFIPRTKVRGKLMTLED